jgi:hypothetical protein
MHDLNRLGAILPLKAASHYSVTLDDRCPRVAQSVNVDGFMQRDDQLLDIHSGTGRLQMME